MGFQGYSWNVTASHNSTEVRRVVGVCSFTSDIVEEYIDALGAKLAQATVQIFGFVVYRRMDFTILD